MRKLLALLALTVATTARAQTTDNKAAADALFDEGQKLVAKGDYAEGCAKFEASLKLLVRVGVKLNLADCYEKAGRTASAWAEFRDAASLAGKNGDEKREKFARERVAALEPYLAKLVIKVSAAGRIDGLTITRDGLPVPEALYDTAVPVDPGEHTIVAKAPHARTWSEKITVVREKEHTVEVPRLEPRTTAEDSGFVIDPERARVAHKRKSIALVVGAVGLAAAGATVAMTLVAKSKWDDAIGSHCDAQRVCDATGLSESGDARTLGDFSTVTAIVGGAALATAIVLYVTAPSPLVRERPVAVAPAVGRGVVGLSLSGAF
jgi:serine/threonine-protein kinase